MTQGSSRGRGFTTPNEKGETIVTERPQRPVSKDAQQKIAQALDDDAKEADDLGYPETAQAIRQQAARYRRDTGQ